jgi:hypothetical protein
LTCFRIIKSDLASSPQGGLLDARQNMRILLEMPEAGDKGTPPAAYA